MKTLEKFKLAQDTSGFDLIINELAVGKKETHWMWFIFPQMMGLGKSPKSRFFGIEDLETAIEYVEDDLLGFRLINCCKWLLDHKNKPIVDILGEIDTYKLRSSMTLFEHAASVSRTDSFKDYGVFQRVLDSFFDGEKCEITLNLLGIATRTTPPTNDFTLESVI